MLIPHQYATLIEPGDRLIDGKINTSTIVEVARRSAQAE